MNILAKLTGPIGSSDQLTTLGSLKRKQFQNMKSNTSTAETSQLLIPGTSVSMKQLSNTEVQSVEVIVGASVAVISNHSQPANHSIPVNVNGPHSDMFTIWSAEIEKENDHPSIVPVILIV